jgi:predicted nucleotidyltransferase
VTRVKGQYVTPPHPAPCYNPPMLPLIEQHRDRIADLCRAHGVSRLDLFGSAANGNFDPTRSDFDLLVDYLPPGPQGGLKGFFGLAYALEALLGHPVDLVDAEGIRNRRFRAEVMKTRENIYAAPITGAA